MAASTWDRSNPMASILAMATSRSAPTVRAEGSLKAAEVSLVVGAADRAGVGVAGAAACDAAWAAGAAGTAGVETAGCAGVAGTADDEAAGAGLGSFGCSCIARLAESFLSRAKEKCS